jgi:beta-glucoside operon transcriptional antiterminator
VVRVIFFAGGEMTVKKILNNNVAITLDEGGRECVVIGRGIGFDKRPGDGIESSKVEKLFSLRESGQTEKFSKIIENIPLEHIQVCDEIISLSKKELPGLGDTIYLTLVDHISFAIERHKDNLDIASSLKGEIKRFYPEEFRVGLQALDIIEKHFAIRLPDDEAAFIAFHLVTAGSSVNVDVENGLRMVKGILEIIGNCASRDFDEESAAYDRLLIHLRYFSRRVLEKAGPDTKKTTGGLIYRIGAEMPEAASCVDRVCRYVEDTYHYTVDDDEKSYLIIHIHSLFTA